MTRQRNKPKCNEGRNNIVVRMRHGIVYSNIKKFCHILLNENFIHLLYYMYSRKKSTTIHCIRFIQNHIVSFLILFSFLFFSLVYLVLLHAVLSRCVIVIVIVIVFVYLFIIYSRFPFFAALP